MFFFFFFDKYSEIQEKIDLEFNEFLCSMVKLGQADAMPYFYWTCAYIERAGKLSFTYYNLSPVQKDLINEAAQIFFKEDSNIGFDINRHSHRNDLSIRNISKLFQNNDSKGQKARYEYIKEYILWYVLDKIGDFSPKIVDAQYRNFIFTYTRYLFSNSQDIPSKEILDEYSSFVKTEQGKYLEKELTAIDQKYIEKKNEDLKYRTSKLYVLNNQIDKLHYIYTKNGAEDKEELRELLDVMGQKDSGSLFRGQANSHWSLISSLHRDDEYMRNESKMFYEILSLKPDAFTNDNSIYERLITMQHYGMPTRLMDVTRNPLIAIFFACNNLQETYSDGVIFTFDDENEALNFENEKLKELEDIHTTKQREVDHILNRTHYVRGVAKNQRISSQCGEFVLIGDNEIDKLRDEPKKIIIVDALSKKKLLEELDSLNIHGGAVYPDLAHMSNYIKEKFASKNRTQSLNLLNEIDSSIYDDKSIEKDNETIFLPSRVIDHYDNYEFWTEERSAVLSKFCKENHLNQPQIVNIIDSHYSDLYSIGEDMILEAIDSSLSIKEQQNMVDKVGFKVIRLVDELIKIS